MRLRRSLTALLALVASLLCLGAASAAAAPSPIDVTVQDATGNTWSYQQGPVEIGSWVGQLPGLIPANGSASFGAVPNSAEVFAGTAIYTQVKTGPIVTAAIHVSAVGPVRAVRCVPFEGSENADCTYRREGGRFVVGLYEPLAAPGPKADLSFDATPAATDLLGGLPVGLETTKPGRATLTLASNGQVAARTVIDPVLPAFPHHAKLKLRPWSRKALRRGDLRRLTLRVRVVDTHGHARTYRRAVRHAPG